MDSSIQVLEMEMAGRLATLQGAAAENAAELDALANEKRARLSNDWRPSGGAWKR